MIAAAEWPDFKTYDAGTLKTVECVAPAKVLKAEVINTEVNSTSNTLSNSYFQNALKYEGVPYKYGGMSENGLDCSGLVNLSMGFTKRMWTTSGGNPPGNWQKLKTNTTSYNNFKKHNTYFAL